MDSPYSNSCHLTIQQLSKTLDIPKPTLRFWEKELEGLIVPNRTSGGQRRYTEDHIALLKEIKELRNSGKSLNEIKTHFNNGEKNLTVISEYEKIDLLSERIAEVVKSEIYKFLQNR